MSQPSMSRSWPPLESNERPGAIAVNALILFAVLHGLTLALPLLRRGSSRLFSATPSFTAFVETLFAVLALWGLLLVLLHAAHELWSAVRGAWPSLPPPAPRAGLPARWSARPPVRTIDGYTIAQLRRAEKPAALTPYPFSVWTYHDGIDAGALRFEMLAEPASQRR